MVGVPESIKRQGLIVLLTKLVSAAAAAHNQWFVWCCAWCMLDHGSTFNIQHSGWSMYRAAQHVQHLSVCSMSLTQEKYKSLTTTYELASNAQLSWNPMVHSLLWPLWMLNEVVNCLNHHRSKSGQSSTSYSTLRLVAGGWFFQVSTRLTIGTMAMDGL